MGWEILIPPAIGGAIGYITNDLAIRMLFKPRKAHYIGRWKIPFTPGLIPKEKARIADSVANVISTQLLDSDTITSVLASEKMTEKVRGLLESAIEKNRDNEETLQSLLSRYFPIDAVNDTCGVIRDDIAEFVCEKLSKTNIPKKMASQIMYAIRDAVVLIRIPIVGDKLAKMIIEPLAGKIGNEITKAIAENAEGVVASTIDKETGKILNSRVCNLIDTHENGINGAIDFIMTLYTKIVTENLPKIVSELDIASIVRNKINSYDEAELEKMILDLMKKELRAIVNLGAVLGFIMGWVNVLINMFV